MSLKSAFTHFLVCYTRVTVFPQRGSHLVNPWFSVCEVKIAPSFQNCQGQFTNDRVSYICAEGLAYTFNFQFVNSVIYMS